MNELQSLSPDAWHWCTDTTRVVKSICWYWSHSISHLLDAEKICSTGWMQQPKVTTWFFFSPRLQLEQQPVSWYLICRSLKPWLLCLFQPAPSSVQPYRFYYPHCPQCLNITLSYSHFHCFWRHRFKQLPHLHRFTANRAWQSTLHPWRSERDLSQCQSSYSVWIQTTRTQLQTYEYLQKRLPVYHPQY